MAEEKRTYFRAKIEIADTWGFEADSEAVRLQVIQLLNDRMDCDVLSVEVELITESEIGELRDASSINELGEYAKH